MGNLAETLLEELNVETAFTIPVFGGIAVAESTVVTWVVMAVLIVLSLILTSNLKVKDPGRRQLFVESAVLGLENMVLGNIGEKGRRYVPYLCTILLFVGLANIFGIFGFKPPTKDLNVTAAVALMSIILVQAAAIQVKGPKGWIKGFAKPTGVVAPLNILELVIRPLSLCMRLFGNVLGAFVVMKLLEGVCPAVLPAAGSIYFDFFDGFIQAYVFVFLTALFIKDAISDEE